MNWEHWYEAFIDSYVAAGCLEDAIRLKWKRLNDIQRGNQ